MPGTIKISQLPAGVTPTGTELVPMTQGGSTVAVTPAQLATYFETLPAITGVVLTLSTPAITVPCDNSGNVLDYGGAVGYLKVYAGQTDVTNSCTVSVQSNTGLTGPTINTAVNTPVSGQPLGYYKIGTITSAGTDQASLTLAAVYKGVTYTGTVTIAKALAGATGSPGTGTSALSIYLSTPSAVVQTYGNGSVVSYAPAQGVLHVFSGTVDVTSSCTGLTATPDSGATTGTINTATNTPVSGQPLGFYEITAMTNATGYLTISATYSGTTLSAVFNVTKANAGYPIVSTLPSSGSLLFNGSIVYMTAAYSGNPANILYQYNGSAWVTVVSATNLTGTLTAAQIASLAASQITGTLTSAQIASITTAQLTGTLTTTQIGSGTIQTGNLAAGSVSTAALAAGAVTAATIAGGTITATQIASGAIGTSQLAAGAVTASTIAANTITASQIAAATITGTQIAASTIATNNIQAGAITAALIAANTITASQIAANTITTNQIASGTITAGNIAANTITASQIAANTITASQLATTGLSASAITTGTLTAAVIDLDGATLTQSGGVLQVNGSGIQTANIASNAVTNLTFGSNSSGGTFGTTLTDLVGSGVSVTVSSAGGPLLITFGVANAYYTGSGGAALYIYRGSTLLFVSISLGVNAATSGYTFKDNPGTGTYTYHVYGASFASATGAYSGAFFTATELKR